MIEVDVARVRWVLGGPDEYVARKMYLSGLKKKEILEKIGGSKRFLQRALKDVPAPKRLVNTKARGKLVSIDGETLRGAGVNPEDEVYGRWVKIQKSVYLELSSVKRNGFVKLARTRAGASTRQVYLPFDFYVWLGRPEKVVWEVAGRNYLKILPVVDTTLGKAEFNGKLCSVNVVKDPPFIHFKFEDECGGLRVPKKGQVMVGLVREGMVIVFADGQMVGEGWVSWHNWRIRSKKLGMFIEEGEYDVFTGQFSRRYAILLKKC